MNKRSVQALDDLEHEVRRHLAAGHQAFVVSIFLMAGGTARYKMQALEAAAQQRLLDMGLAVNGMEHRDWEYRTFFQVHAPQVRPAEKQCPMCAETIKAAALICRYCGSDVSHTVPAPAAAFADVGFAAATPGDAYSEDDDDEEREPPWRRVGARMCPRAMCDEAGLRTEDERCGVCGTPTVPWE